MGRGAAKNGFKVCSLPQWTPAFAFDHDVSEGEGAVTLTFFERLANVPQCKAICTDGKDRMDKDATWCRASSPDKGGSTQDASRKKIENHPSGHTTHTTTGYEFFINRTSVQRPLHLRVLFKNEVYTVELSCTFWRPWRHSLPSWKIIGQWYCPCKKRIWNSQIILCYATSITSLGKGNAAGSPIWQCCCDHSTMHYLQGNYIEHTIRSHCSTNSYWSFRYSLLVVYSTCVHPQNWITPVSALLISYHNHS